MMIRNMLVAAAMLMTVAIAHAQETQTREVGSFTGVKVAEGIDVYLKKGDKESVRVEVTNTKVQNVVTEVSGSYLKVHMRDGGSYRNVDVRVYVTYVNLDRLSASSAGSIFCEGTLKADRLEINASSAGNVELMVEAGQIEASASSAGEVELKGKARGLTAEASSAGKVDAYDMEAQQVTAEASSGGSVKVYVLNALDGNASSGGAVRYRGNPAKTMTHSSSGGSVKKAN